MRVFPKLAKKDEKNIIETKKSDRKKRLTFFFVSILVCAIEKSIVLLGHI